MKNQTPKLLGKLYERIQTQCRAAGIENSSQLAVAIARTKGDQRIASELSQTAPNDWWQGRRAPDAGGLMDILQATGGSADYLLLGRGPVMALPERALAALAEVLDAGR